MPKGGPIKPGPSGFGQAISPIDPKPLTVGGGPIKPGPGQTFALGAGGPQIATRPASVAQLIRPSNLQSPYSVTLPPSAINRIAPKPPSEIRGTVAGAYSPIPIVYGQTRVIGSMFRWIKNTWFTGIYVFCRGEIEGFLRLSIDGREIDVSAKGSTEFRDDTLTGASGYCQLFTGSPTQDLTADATAAGRVDSGTWTTDTYANYACAVIQLSRDDFDLRSIPRVEAVLQGRKDIYDPRSSPDQYTSNSALCLAHFLTTYVAPGTSVDDTTLTAVANRADGVGAGNTLSDSSKRHTWGMVVGERPQRMQDLAAFLESAARCYAWEESGTWYFTPDGPTSSSHTITASQVLKGSATVRGVSADEQPADVRVRWYDPTANVSGLAEALGNVSGTVSEISAPWISSHPEAKRYAVERYNHLQNENLKLQFDIPSVGAKMRRGEVLTYTDATLGLSSKAFRITQLETPALGIWRVYCREYLASTYSDSIASDPVTGTGPPDINAVSPPSIAVAGSAIAVGRLAQLDLTFEDATNSPQQPLAYPFFDQIRVDVYDANVSPESLLATHYTNSQAGTSISGLPAGVDFYVEARVISTAGVQSAPGSTSISRPAFPAPSAPTGATLTLMGPAIDADENDAARYQVTIAEVDSRAYIGYKVRLRMMYNGDFTSSSANFSNGIPTTFPVFREWDFGPRNSGEVIVPHVIVDDDYDAATIIQYMTLTVAAYSSSGAESAEQPVLVDSGGGALGGGYIGAFYEASAIVTVEGEYTDLGEPSPQDGTRLITFSLRTVGDSQETKALLGWRIRVYDCDASAANRTLLNTLFVSIQDHYAADPSRSATLTNWLGTDLDAGAWLNWEDVTLAISQPSASGYRCFTVQYVGVGDIVSAEDDMTNTVGGAVALAV